MSHVAKMKVSSIGSFYNKKIFRGPGFDPTIYIDAEILEKGLHPHPL